MDFFKFLKGYFMSEETIDEVVTPEVVAEDTTPLVETPVVEVSEPKEVIFYGGQVVVEKLTEGETADDFLCKMADGSTQHVPKSFFA